MIKPREYIERNKNSWLFRKAKEKPVTFLLLALFFYIVLPIIALIILIYFLVH